MPEQPADKLRKRAEEVLGWREGESNCFSLPTLTSFVREKAPKLHPLGPAVPAVREADVTFLQGH